MKLGLGLALAATAALGACATTTRSGPVEVSRFHLGAPLESGTLTTEPQPNSGPPSLEFKTYAAAVETEALRNGFSIPASGTTAQYVAVIGFNRTVRQGPPRSGGLTIGLGGGGYSGGYNGGVGVGGGVSFPIGKRRYREIVVTQLTVQIRRRSDATVIWEGRAETSADGTAPEAQPGLAAAKVAAAMFQGFPGGIGSHYHGEMTQIHPLTINAAFDSGNIDIVGVEGDRVTLNIRHDRLSDFYQWFHFRVSGARGRTLTFRIANAGSSAYPFRSPGYKVRVSTDRETWRMAPTRYVDGALEFEWTGTSELVWFAYFQPYTMERHDALVARIAGESGVTHRELGRSLDGRAIDCLEIGSGPKHVWLYARQHPGESMAEWFMEGALERLTDAADPVTRALLAKATFHCVPNMNPDGSFRGHLRTNAAGVNLNREWGDPTPERSPEVLCVRNAMDETGVAFAMDVHGDEAIPANFLAGFEGIPSWTDALGAKYYDFGRRLEAHTRDFQTAKGYDKAAPGRANLTMSTNQLAERFGAVSMTLEMPFKDHDPNPDAEFGWSGERSKKLAHACLEVLAQVIDTI